MSKQDLLRFKLSAHLQSEKNKRSIAEHDRQRFEENAKRLYAHVSELFANEPGIQITPGDDDTQDTASNAGWLEIDIVGKKVRISPVLKDGERALDVSGLDQDFYFELEHNEWRVTPKRGYGWTSLDDDFWFTKLADLVPK